MHMPGLGGLQCGIIRSFAYIHTYNLYLYTIIEKAYSLWGHVIKENQIIKIRYNNKKLQFSSVHVKVKNN